MRAFLHALVLAAALTATFSPEPARAAGIDFAALPEGAPIAKPKRSEVPAAIPAREHASGYVVTRQSYGSSGVILNRVGEELPYVPESNVPEDQPLTCYATFGPIQQKETEKPSFEQLTPSLAYVDGTQPIAAVRSERLVEENGRTRLEGDLIWIDTRTRGSRIGRHVVLELERVAEPYPGVAVFAARTGPDSVDFVIRNTPSRELGGKTARRPAFKGTLGFRSLALAGLVPSAAQIVVSTPEGEESKQVFSSCGYVRTRLHATSKESATTTVTTAAVITIGPQVLGRAPNSPQDNPALISVVQVRALAVSLGLSVPDTKPVPSVSYRWTEAAHSVEIAEPLPQATGVADKS